MPSVLCCGLVSLFFAMLAKKKETEVSTNEKVLITGANNYLGTSFETYLNQ